MAKGKSTRREFDWRTYSKPPRQLTAEQEKSLSDGVLSPLLSWARDTGSVRFEIRSRQAAIYHAGTMLLRIRGAEQPFFGEIDANVRLPRTARTGAERLETWPLSSADEVSAAVAELDALRVINDEHMADDALSERGVLHAFATANDARSNHESRVVVADVEFQYGKRRFDFIGLRRADGVSGLAGFTTPRLVVGQFSSDGRPLTGSSGVVAHASDFAELVQALGGAHMTAARTELDELVRQKLRLGLLNQDVPFRHFTEDDPEYLVVFSGYDLASSALDAPLAEMHDKLVARHFQPELLKFTAVDSGRPPSPDPALAMGSEDGMSYREFKRYRKHLREQVTDSVGSTKG